MLSFFDIFVLGILDGIGPYSMAAAGVLLSAIIILRSNRSSRSFFTIFFIVSFIVSTYLFVIGGGDSFFLTKTFLNFAKTMTYIVSGILLASSLFLFMAWSRKYFSGPLMNFSVPSLPLCRFCSLFSAILGLSFGSLWALAANIWPPSAQITIFSIDNCLPAPTPRFLLYMVGYVFFKTTLLFFIAAGNGSFLTLWSRTQFSAKYRQICLMIGSGYLGAVGFGLLALLMKRV